MKIFNNNSVNSISQSDLPDDIRGKVKVGDKIRVSFPATESEATVTDIGQSYPNNGAMILDKPLTMDIKPEITIVGDTSDEKEPMNASGVVDTSVLSGPIGGLKDFLIKKQRDNDEQAQ